MFCYFCLVFYVVKRLRVFFFFLYRTLYKFWYYSIIIVVCP